MGRVRVLLADDHKLFVDALTKLLESDFDVVGATSDGRDVVGMVRELRPDVVILDISMPYLNGLEAGQRVKQLYPDTKIIFLTQNQEVHLATEAFRHKASGYLLKNSAATELIAAIGEAVKGNTYVSPLIAEALLSRLSNRNQLESQELTSREREVLQLLAEGNSMKEIGAMLNISTRTVEFHKHKIMERLNAKTNADLIRHAIKQGLVQ
jgi:DNA-binding NarL/FixJ family response regulator